MNPVTNDTKWRELRAAMLSLEKTAPRWRSRDVETGHVSSWDGDWFYHFAEGGYRNIEWVELRVRDSAELDSLHAALSRIHLPGERIDRGFRIYGCVQEGEAVDYIRPAG